MAIDKRNLATVETMWRREVEAAAHLPAARRARARSEAPRHPAAPGRAGRQARRALVRAHRAATGQRPDPTRSRARPDLVPAHRRSERRAAAARAGREPRPKPNTTQLMARLSDPDDRQIAEEAMLEERDHAVILRDAGRRDDCRRRARRSTRFSAASAGTSAAPAGSATRSTASTTASAPSSASSPAWPATPAAAKSCSRRVSPARSRARCRWARARIWRRSREREVYESEVSRERAEIEEDPHEEMLELELFYQLKGFSAEEARAMAERISEGAEAVPAHAGPRRARAVGGNVSQPAGARRSRRRVSTAIGGFIPIIPFFFTVGMPAVIASFVISTLAHFASARRSRS